MLPAPEWLSDTYIGMFIQQAEEEGMFALLDLSEA
jgi:hypothetical protein